MFKSLRVQLTLWYVAFFSALFLLFAVGLYTVLARSVARHLDETLIEEAHTGARLLREELTEAQGNGVVASGEVVRELQPRANGIAILESARLLAAGGAVPQAQIEAGNIGGGPAETTWTIPDWGEHGGRAAAESVPAYGRNFVVIATAPLDATEQSLRLVRDALWWTVPPLIALAALGGYLLTRRGLAPLNAMVEQSRRIGGENLHERLKVGNAAAELTTLAKTFNELLSRLDTSFETMRRFVQDASHELRTPLAVIRGEADVALAHERTPAEYRESLATIHEESRRLSRLVEDLLNLARADAGRVNLRMEELYLNDLLAECCRSMQALAAARDIRLECQAAEDIAVRGDEELLRRMVLNLLDNAIRYTPPGGTVAASAEAKGPDVRIRVADTGIGIPPEAAPHVFDRFYRADSARSRTQGGFGLGLSIVKWIADSHHAEIDLASEPGRGSTFTVRLRR